MKKILIGIIRFYQKHISPATPPSCRFHPTCSSYALEAVEKHGALKGGVMGTARIIRCNPFVEGGVDQVPDYFTVRRNPENIGEYHLPAYLLQADPETKKEIEQLSEKYGSSLNISTKLPDPFDILKEIVDLKEVTREELKQEFTEEEVDYLSDIQVLPDSEEDYQYFTLTDTAKNNKYLQEVLSYDEGIDLGKDHPLIILEKTGIWYMNLPKLMDDFLIRRGVTEEDLNNNSYHLWLVLKALETVENN